MARPTRRPGNLPAEANSFVGRHRELAEIRKTLAGARLVSLVGPGGVGKTRLAVRAATELARGFPDGGWLVELAEVLDPALVAGAVMTALGLRDQAATEPLALTLSYLREKDLLLVLDNCEHLLEATARFVTEVLRAAPDVRVLATSREPLSVAAEHVVPVSPLELPGPHSAVPLARLRQNEAVSLFTDRAAAASGTFELTAANRAAVVDLCRRLDGLPLAIELAAVRTRVLTAEQILDRLSDRFSLLTGGSRAALPRHQTLRTAIEWSHDLLTEDERAVLRRSCAFASRFTLEDLASVCTSEDTTAAQALDLLSSLVEKSLVIREDSKGLACYRLHETMREFAALKLREAGEHDAVMRRCAEYYRSRCRSSAWDGCARLLEWLAWVDVEIDNIRAILQRCVAHADAACGIDLVTSLNWYWATRATTEGLRWLGEFLALGGGDPQARAWADFLQGFLAVLKADPAAARPALRAAAAAARQTGQQDLLSEALCIASVAENIAGDRTAAKRLLEEAQVTTSGLDYLHGTVSVLQARALGALFETNLDAVMSAASEGAVLARAAGDLYALEMMLVNLGCAALIAGDLDECEPLFTEALQIARQIDDRVAQFYLLDAFGCHAALRGRARLAANLIGAADAVRAEVGTSAPQFLGPQLAQAEASAAAALGAAGFRAEFAAGKRLGREAAVRLALSKSTNIAASPPGDAHAAPLGKREADVARLVADGLTNKQIGVRLFISERTVDSHVRSILNKLGFNSRAQVAVWMASADG